jgi:pimeloyl-ACP methyl ester carboxylesterase
LVCSQDFRGQPGKSASSLANAGYTVVVFDPDGRGRGEGSEDNNGFVQQDGLAAIVQFAATLPEVNADEMGLVSFSYGVTLASGVIARYPNLNVQFLIDWEGPADRNDTGGCDEDRTGHLVGMVGCDDEMFWAEREALTFISRIGVPYQRLQTKRDHAQPDVLSALQMVNAAVDGQSPWVRLNDLPPNQTYDPSASPPMLPDAVDGKLMDLIVEYAPELSELK